MNEQPSPDEFVKQGRKVGDDDDGEPLSRGTHRPSPRLLSSAAFVASFVPPDFIWDGILQRGFIYSLTAPTGTGKTAIALLIAAKLAMGSSIGGRETQRGSVAVLSGENSDDVRMRWIVMAERMGFDADAIDVHFVEGTFSLTDFTTDVVNQIDKLPDCALVIVDTSAAYFEGSEENNNVELGNHARKQRRFTQCSSRPCVLALCHPTKNAASDNLLPRGGGAFLAEVDGNLCLKALTDTAVELHWQGKLRGPGFEPVNFDLVKTSSEKLRDSRNRKMLTVIANDLTSAEAEARQQSMVSRDDQVLLAIDGLDEPTVSAIAEHLGWIGATGEPQKSVVHRALKRLEGEGLVKRGRGGQYDLTKSGEAEALKATRNAVPHVERYRSHSNGAGTGTEV